MEETSSETPNGKKKKRVKKRVKKVRNGSIACLGVQDEAMDGFTSAPGSRRGSANIQPNLPAEMVRRNSAVGRQKDIMNTEELPNQAGVDSRRQSRAEEEKIEAEKREAERMKRVKKMEAEEKEKLQRALALFQPRPAQQSFAWDNVFNDTKNKTEDKSTASRNRPKGPVMGHDMAMKVIRREFYVLIISSILCRKRLHHLLILCVQRSWGYKGPKQAEEFPRF